MKLNLNLKVEHIARCYLTNTNGASANERVVRAFDQIHHFRDKHCANDPATVAAEHYLFARSITGEKVASGIAWFVFSLPINAGYDFVKELAKLASKDFKVTDCPSSDAHCYIRMWAHKGAGDGFKDYGESVPVPPKAKDVGFVYACGWDPRMLPRIRL